MDQTNQKGTLVSPGAQWFPQAYTIVRITTAASDGAPAVVASPPAARPKNALVARILLPTRSGRRTF